MKAQCDVVLEEWRTKLEQAIADFRVHFNIDGHFSDTMMTIQEKNNFSHSAFVNLQREFQIPTVEEGLCICTLLLWPACGSHKQCSHQ
jgi:hypothetical protein